MPRSAPRLRALLGLILGLVAVGCTREVAAGLDEADANRGIVALARAAVDAEKIPDPQADGKFRLVVGRDEATIAISVLAAEEIPRVRPAAPPSGALVSSPEADRAARILATAAQIERTIASIDGVHDARVHLDVPVVDPLANALGDGKLLPRATASILVRHRGPVAPVADGDLRKLVAGAVSGLDPEAVAIVGVVVPPATVAGDRELAHVGPIAVARGSLSTLRAVAAIVLGFVALLSTALVALAIRLRRAKDEAQALALPNAPRAR
jgi:type III secretion protein J